MANSDVASVVERICDLDAPRGDWLTRVTESLRPFLDRHHLGAVGAFYTCPDASTWRIESTVVQDVVPRILLDYLEFLSAPPATLLDDTVLSRRWYVCSQLRRWSDVQQAFDAMPVAADKLTLTTIEPDGGGVLFGSFQRHRIPPSQSLAHSLTLFATHLTAAHRLRTDVSRPNTARPLSCSTGRALARRQGEDTGSGRARPHATRRARALAPARGGKSSICSRIGDRSSRWD